MLNVYNFAYLLSFILVLLIIFLSLGKMKTSYFEMSKSCKKDSQ